MQDDNGTGRTAPARPWDGLLSEAELELYRNAGFLREFEVGERPALLVIDAQYNFTGDRPEPVADSAKSYRFSCGEHAWESLPYLRRLLSLARSKGMPVVYTRDTETFPDPTPEEAARGNDIVADLAPQDGETVIEKRGYSAFFSTRMLSYLISLSIDTVIVCGGTTSGCVRATVTDAFDYRFRVLVPQDCVFDRALTPHRVDLFDIAAKAGRVLSLAELEHELDGRDFHSAYGATEDSPTWRYVAP